MRERPLGARCRRRAMTLLELLFAAVVAALPLLVIMTLLGSNVRGTAHNRERVTVQLLLSNMVDRYGRLSVDRLQTMFGDDSGGAEAIDGDALLNGSQAWTSAELVQWGFRRECFLQLTGGSNIGAVLYVTIAYRDVFGRLQRVGAKSVLTAVQPPSGTQRPRPLAPPASPSLRAVADRPSRSSFATSLRGTGASPSRSSPAPRRSRLDDALPLSSSVAAAPSASSESAVLDRLVDRLRTIDGRDGRLDYDWGDVEAPDDEAGALARTCAVLRTVELPDGDYPFTYERLDYRALAPDFATAVEELELLVFVLDDVGRGRQYLLLLERHFDRRRAEPVCQFMDGQMLRDEGYHRLLDGTGGGCAVAVTPQRLFVGRSGRDRDGQVSDTTYVMHVRKFARAWAYEAQMAADGAGGKRGTCSRGR